MKNPKDKAEELFLKFRQIPPSSPYTGIDDVEAKQCALVAIDEIINTVECVNYNEIELDINYWQMVKQELEKL